MRKTFYKYLVYSAIYIIINLTAFIINAQDRQIYTYQSRREKLIWVVKDKELKSWPKVNLEKDDIPLSISKAYRNAHKYICKYYGHPILVSVSLLPVHPESVAASVIKPEPVTPVAPLLVIMATTRMIGRLGHNQG